MIDYLLERLPVVSCAKATRLISEALERKLSLREQVSLRLHLLVCSLCTRFQRQIKGLHALLSSYQPAGEGSLPQKIKENIKESLRRQQ